MESVIRSFADKGTEDNGQFRICFRWEEGYADDVEIADYH